MFHILPLLPLLVPFLRPIIGELAQVGAGTDMLALQAEVEAFLRASTGQVL